MIVSDCQEAILPPENDKLPLIPGKHGTSSNSLKYTQNAELNIFWTK